MIGNNELILNQATMCEAMQCYIEKVWSASALVGLKVESVKENKTDEFTIKINRTGALK